MSGTPALVPVGHTVGIKLFSRGVMVVKLTDGGTPARAGGLRTGDVIVKCAGSTVTSSEQFQDLLQESAGAATDLQVKRAGGSVTLSVEPEPNEAGVYCIGAWIRDSMPASAPSPTTTRHRHLRRPGPRHHRRGHRPADALLQRLHPALHGEGREEGPAGRGRGAPGATST